MRLTEYFHYLQTGHSHFFTHLSLVSAMERQRKILRKEDKDKSQKVKAPPQVDLLAEN